METADVRRRVQRAIAAAKADAVARRDRVAAAEAAGHAVLARVATPLVKTVAAALRAEGYRATVSTPAEAVRLELDETHDRFVELALDTTRDPPALVGRVGRARGSRVLQEEHVVAHHPAIGDLTDEALLEVLLRALAPVV